MNKRLALGAVLCALAAPASLAQEARLFGADAPFTIEQLPLGQLRSSLEALTPEARERALEWLHSFSFPEADLDNIHVDADGGVFYIDSHLPEAGAAETEGTSQSEPQTGAGAAVDNVFALHSKPGASKIIFVDFDGHTITGTAWNGNTDPLYAKPFDTDGNPTSFSDAEKQKIAEIWYRIAEDYAAFDVDVTTEAPASFGPHTGHLLLTDDSDELGRAMPAQGAGGVAYVNVFGRSNYPYYSPALVYADNLGPDFPPYVVEAASHEMGHNMGLGHDGTSSKGYYGGHGSGAVSWGPIMGTGYGRNVSQWSQGEYSDANNQQDDIAIIAGKVSMAADDHADTRSGASLLVVNGDGSISHTTPQNDADNADPANKGVIGSRSDVDVFAFSSAAGTVELTVKPAWAAFYRANNRGANLDIKATLSDANGNVLATADPQNDTAANLSANVAAGTYYLSITGVGSSQSPYNDYGSQGHYFISGNVPPAAPDVTAPTPNPMTWALAPTASGHSSLSMTATTATDDNSGELQYYFACVAGGSGCSDSGWQTSTQYSASGLSPETSYSWQVKARDLAGNETGYSNVASASTEALPTPPAAPSAMSAQNRDDSSAALSWSDNSDNENGFEVQRQKLNNGSWGSTTTVASTGANVTSVIDQSGTGTFRYRVRATNDGGASAYSGWAQVEVTQACSGLIGCALDSLGL